MAKTRVLSAAAVLIVMAIGGCVYTWRPYWWNFYERGISRASEGQLQEATQDFETAAGERKGATVARPNDARRVRTYGMHFIDDYFPHRELGIAHYRMNRFVEAEKELLVSLSQTPSAKAKAYLNLVRREMLRQKPAQAEPPSLELQLASGKYLNSDTTTLSGVAQSKNYVSSVFVDGGRLFVELAEPELRFSRELKLRPGANQVVVETIDLVGKAAKKTLLLNVDMTYPAVVIQDVVKTNQEKVAVSGAAMDNSGISRLVVAGRPQAIDRPTTEVEFSVEAAVGDMISVEVTDIAGNTTSARVSVTPDMLQPGEEGVSRPVLLAELGSGRLGDFTSGTLLLSQKAAGGDQTPPTITLRDVVENRVIYDNQFIFDGMARDNGRLAVLSVNGEDLLGSRTGVLIKYFTHRATLKEGENRFTVVAVDKAGNRSEKTFQVIRKIQEALQVGARLTLALLPLQQGGAAQAASSQVYDLLIGSFLECGRFNLVERDEAVFKALLTELKIGSSELADKTTAVRIGRMKTAEGMIYGKTIEDDRSVAIDLWLVDTETSEILFFADVYGEDKSRDELKWLMDGLVLKYRQRFPLVRGKVTGVSEAGLSINNGALDGIWSGMKYLVLKEEKEGAPGALTLINAGGKALEARVRTVQPQSCFAELAVRTATAPVAVNDPVITK